MIPIVKDNIIIASVERCGASWVGGIISEVHKQMYGEIKHRNWGISRIIATTNKYVFPKGFNEVLLINPLKLLDRPYDKIIVIKREKEGYMKAMQIYRCPELTYEETWEKHPDFIKECEFYYDLCYNHEFTDPRIFLVSLEDLNNYTEATFSNLLDFLEYPTHTYQDTINYISDHLKNMNTGQILDYLKEHPLRVCLVPINPEYRNWEVISCQIPKDWGLDPMGVDIQEHDPQKVYSNNKRMKLEEKGIGYLLHQKKEVDESKLQYTQYTHNPLRPNPYVLAPEEYKLQNHRAFRVYKELMPDALKILELL